MRCSIEHRSRLARSIPSRLSPSPKSNSGICPLVAGLHLWSSVNPAPAIVLPSSASPSCPHQFTRPSCFTLSCSAGYSSTWGTHSFIPAQKVVCLSGHLVMNRLFCCCECVLFHLILSHVRGNISTLFIVLTAIFTIPGRGGLEGSWSQGLLALSTCLSTT